MSKRFYYDEFLEEIYDEQINDYPSNQSICGILNQQAERIAELEEQLANSIRPKFKIGDKVYAIIDTWAYTDVFPVEIRDTHLLYEVWDGQDTTKQHYTRIFATKEEAEAKLRELQGESK